MGCGRRSGRSAACVPSDLRSGVCYSPPLLHRPLPPRCPAAARAPPAPSLPAARPQLESIPPYSPLSPCCPAARLQLEAIPPYFWVCGWRCYLAFFPQYLDKHIAAASAMGKPFVVEEFNVLLQ